MLKIQKVKGEIIKWNWNCEWRPKVEAQNCEDVADKL